MNINNATPTARRAGFNWLPAIRYPGGIVKVIYGPPLPTAAIAKKYAQLEINNLRNHQPSNLEWGK